MPRTYAWHSTEAGIAVYHNNTLCSEGTKIKRRYQRLGTGGKRLCTRCDSLNRMGR